MRHSSITLLLGNTTHEIWNDKAVGQGSLRMSAVIICPILSSAMLQKRTSYSTAVGRNLVQQPPSLWRVLSRDRDLCLQKRHYSRRGNRLCIYLYGCVWQLSRTHVYFRSRVLLLLAFFFLPTSNQQQFGILSVSLAICLPPLSRISFYAVRCTFTETETLLLHHCATDHFMSSYTNVVIDEVA